MFDDNEIYNMDCIDGMRKIPSGGVDFILTDPPYLIKYSTSWRDDGHKFSHEILNDDNEKLVSEYISECYRILREDSAAYMFCSSKTLDFFMRETRNVGFIIKNVLIWQKNNHTAGDLEAQYGQCYEPILYLNKGRRVINGKRLEDVWEFDRMWLSDSTPKYSESVCLSLLHHYLRVTHEEIKYLISYADTSIGNTGTIYKAANYELIGSLKADFYVLPSGERIHPISMWHRHRTRKWNVITKLYPGIRKANGFQLKFLMRL